MQPRITLVLSVYNENEAIPFLCNRLKDFTSSFRQQVEIIFVNDGSVDNSLQALETHKSYLASDNVDIRIINFARNFGHEAAMIAGIDHAQGEAIICLDADLQHPIECIAEMIRKFEEGFDVVTMKRVQNDDVSKINAFMSKAFYRIINRLSQYKIEENASDFFLISKRVASVLKANFRERNRFLRGLIQIIGFNYTTLDYTAPKRVAGKTKYSFIKLVILTTSAIAGFSKFPLYLGIYFGFLFALLSLILGIYTLSVYIIGINPPSGYTTIVLFVSISFSILFFLIGIIGIYVGYIFDEEKNRPIYIVKDIL